MTNFQTVQKDYYTIENNDIFEDSFHYFALFGHLFVYLLAYWFSTCILWLLALPFHGFCFVLYCTCVFCVFISFFYFVIALVFLFVLFVRLFSKDRERERKVMELTHGDVRRIY